MLSMELVDDPVCMIWVVILHVQTVSTAAAARWLEQHSTSCAVVALHPAAYQPAPKYARSAAVSHCRQATHEELQVQLTMLSMVVQAMPDTADDDDAAVRCRRRRGRHLAHRRGPAGAAAHNGACRRPDCTDRSQPVTNFITSCIVGREVCPPRTSFCIMI